MKLKIGLAALEIGNIPLYLYVHTDTLSLAHMVPQDCEHQEPSSNTISRATVAPNPRWLESIC